MLFTFRINLLWEICAAHHVLSFYFATSTWRAKESVDSVTTVASICVSKGTIITVYRMNSLQHLHRQYDKPERKRLHSKKDCINLPQKFSFIFIAMIHCLSYTELYRRVAFKKYKHAVHKWSCLGMLHKVIPLWFCSFTSPFFISIFSVFQCTYCFLSWQTLSDPIFHNVWLRRLTSSIALISSRSLSMMVMKSCTQQKSNCLVINLITIMIHVVIRLYLRFNSLTHLRCRG